MNIFVYFQMARATWLFYVAKFVELLDTVSCPKLETSKTNLNTNIIQKSNLFQMTCGTHVTLYNEA